MADTTGSEEKPRENVCQSSDFPPSIVFLQHQEKSSRPTYSVVPQLNAQEYQGDLQLSPASFNEQQISQ